MSWNLFEKIINVIMPSKSSEQPSEEYDEAQPQWPESSSGNSQQWPESSSQQPQDSQEPSPSYQETPSAPEQDN